MPEIRGKVGGDFSEQFARSPADGLFVGVEDEVGEGIDALEIGNVLDSGVGGDDVNVFFFYWTQALPVQSNERPSDAGK